jgi:hypothetical protein
MTCDLVEIIIGVLDKYLEDRAIKVKIAEEISTEILKNIEIDTNTTPSGYCSNNDFNIIAPA